MTARAKDLTLAVPCYNAARYLPQTLEGCLRQTVAPAEILVVDDGSTDGSGSLLADYPVRVLRHETNQGIAEARNTALQNTSTPLVAFVDADARPCSGLIEKVIARFEEQDVVGVGGRGLELESRSTADRWRSVFWQQTHGDERIDDVWMLMGLCCAFRTEALRVIGGFDGRYRRTAEDVDVSLRLRTAGGRLVYDPDIWVMHRRKDTPLTLARMIGMHAHGQTRAVLSNGGSVCRLHTNALRWMLVPAVSSLRRHRSLSMAAMSIPLGLISVASRLAAHRPGGARA